MQALAERLDVAIAGRRIERIHPLAFASLKTFAPDPASLVGEAVEHVSRRGKYVVWGFGAGTRILFHLSQGGRVDLEDPPKATKPRGALVRFTFAGGPAVLLKEFGTERKAGWWVLAPGDDGPLVGLGPDIDTDAFAELVATTTDRRRLHTFLRDQRTVAGLGRGYTDDALHRAGLSPFATVASLEPESRQRLVDAVRAALADGLTIERRRTGGLPTKLGDHWVVHKRAGEACPNGCGDTLARVSFDSYEMTYCPNCQTDGRVLADRRLSRLLK